MFLDYDETHGASASYDFSNSGANGRVKFCLRLWDSLFKFSFTYFFILRNKIDSARSIDWNSM